MCQLGPISERKRASVCKPRLLALAGQQKRKETLLPGKKRQATKTAGNKKYRKVIAGKKGRQQKRQETLFAGNKKNNCLKMNCSL